VGGFARFIQWLVVEPELTEEQATAMAKSIMGEHRGENVSATNIVAWVEDAWQAMGDER
jgi:hypothetical protein